MVAKPQTDPILRRLLFRHASVRLKEADVTDAALDEIINAADFESYPLKDAANDVLSRIEEIQKNSHYTTIAMSTATAVLLLSIVGIRPEFSLLGIKLGDIKHAKEFIFAAILFADMYLVVMDGVNSTLKRLHMRLKIKLHGENNTALLEITSKYGPLNANLLLPQYFHERYELSLPKMLIDTLSNWILIMMMVLFIFIVLGMQIVILFDIWNNSNFDPFWGKCFSIFGAVVMSTSFLTKNLKSQAKFSYIDSNLASKYLVEKDKDSIKYEFRALYFDQLNRIQVIRHTIFVSLLAGIILTTIYALS